MILNWSQPEVLLPESAGDINIEADTANSRKGDAELLYYRKLIKLVKPTQDFYLSCLDARMQ